MEIYKLKYSDKETALKDLFNKGVYKKVKDFLAYGNAIHAVVEIGLIVLEKNNSDKHVYADGYHFDIMSENKIDFGSNEIQVNNPKHTFSS